MSSALRLVLTNRQIFYPMKPSKLSAITIRRLRRVRDAILKEPLLYDQDCPSVDRSCDTPGCILGWANALFPTPSTAVLIRHRQEAPDESSVVIEAAARLRLTHDQAIRLWNSGDWPNPFRDKEHIFSGELDTSRARARNAAKRITHFIKTGGAE